MASQNEKIVQFVEVTPSIGDFNRFKFRVLSINDKDEDSVYVRVSGSLIPSRSEGDQFHWHKVSAKAVEMHLLGKVSEENYVEGEVMVTTYWQPDGLKGDYEEFVVDLPKKPMGLI